MPVQEHQVVIQIFSIVEIQEVSNLLFLLLLLLRLGVVAVIVVVIVDIDVVILKRVVRLDQNVEQSDLVEHPILRTCVT